VEEKTGEYQDLAIELRRLRKVKTKVIPKGQVLQEQ